MEFVLYLIKKSNGRLVSKRVASLDKQPTSRNHYLIFKRIIISRTQHSTSQEKKWWPAHQSTFSTEAIYQRTAIDNYRACLTPHPSAQGCSRLAIKEKLTFTQTKVFLIQYIWTGQLMVISKFFSTFCIYTSRVPPNKMFPEPSSTDCKITVCFLSFANSSNTHSLKSFKVDALHTKLHLFLQSCPKGWWYCITTTSIFLSSSYRNERGEITGRN